jgi:hypothetical protein
LKLTPLIRFVLTTLGIAQLACVAGALAKEKTQACEKSPLVHRQCLNIDGKLEFHNGSAPNFFIYTDKQAYEIGPKRMPIMPRALTDEITPSGFPLQGRFRLCPLKKQERHDIGKDKPHTLYCVESFLAEGSKGISQ